ncbi:MAG: hypothetical protein WB791_01285 [Waddliaceae bacterium]
MSGALSPFSVRDDVSDRVRQLQRAQEENRLKKNLLHFEPISARAFNAIRYSCAVLHRRGPKSGWEGKALRVLTVSASGIGCILTTLGGLGETAVSSSLFFLAIAFHQITQKKHVLAEKIIAKSLSYSINSGITVAIAIAALVSSSARPVLMPRYRIIATGISRFNYFMSAIMGQFFVGYAYGDEDIGRVRCGIASWEAAPDALSRLRNSFVADLDIQTRNSFVADLDIQTRNFQLRQFYEGLPADIREFFLNFDFSRYRREEQYRNQLHNQLTLIAPQLMQAWGIEVIAEGNEFRLDTYGNEVKPYRDNLIEYVKMATRQMVEHKWAKYLSQEEDFEKGKELLESFDASATIPLAHIAQFIELQEEDSQCPNLFSHRDLQRYSSRKGKIDEAKELLSGISEDEKNSLIRQLIKGRVPHKGAQTQVDKLYLKITELAGDLHQGKLMCLLTFNANSIEFSSEHLFGKAWRDALNEQIILP